MINSTPQAGNRRLVWIFPVLALLILTLKRLQSRRSTIKAATRRRQYPVVPQNIEVVSENNVDKVFPVDRKLVIVDPKESLKNYDNELSRRDLLSLPALDYDTQSTLRDKYNSLHAKVIKAGLYQCEYSNYIRELVKIGSLLLYSFSFLHLGYYTISAVLIATAWHQMTFIAHDAGHVSITHNYQFDNVFGMVIASWCGGLSLGWWKRNHNVHHLITNDPVHDPDIQHLPFLR